MRVRFGNLRGSFLSLLEIIIVLVIILFMAQRVIQNYFQRPVMDKPVETMAHDAGISTVNYQSIMQSTKDKIKNIMEQHQDQLESNFK